MRKLMAAVASATILGWAGIAQSGLMCNQDTADKVTNTAGCELGSTNNDKLNPLQVNIDEMFGFDDWVFAQRDNKLNSRGTDRTVLDIGLKVRGKRSGSWIIDDIWSEVDDVLLVFKGGADKKTDPNVYVGYLVAEPSIDGTYKSPFANTNNDNPRNIFHVSAYVRGVSVPEPGPLALLGLGLALMGWVHRKKRV